jgi:hypothetical protein
MMNRSIVENAAREIMNCWNLGEETLALETITEMINNLEDQLGSLKAMREVLLSPGLPVKSIIGDIENSYKNRDGKN